MNPLLLPQVMVSMANTRSLPEVLNEIVKGVALCSNVALVRIWLKDQGDICEVCRLRSECPDQTACLHLVASAGNPVNGQDDYTRLDGAFRRFPIGVRKIGRTAQSGEPLLLPDLTGTEPWIAHPEWFAREKIRTFAAQPVKYQNTILGVIAIFDRAVLGASEFEWLHVLADHAAVSIANARAFEEIEFLRTRLAEENDYLRNEVTEALGVGDIIGSSPALRKVTEQIRLVSPTDASVLITGESGTGKELVARAIHDNSARKDRALIKVNCGAIPEGLFESEFFGHVKGAFTGALRDRPGRFELADGGTLFLDEIGEVPLELQAKLLRVLQEHEVERVGDTRTRNVNVRIIAATNHDLQRDAAAGRFRQDLYYRLSVFPIDVPPLRERREDIATLVTFFVNNMATRMKRPVPRLPKNVMRDLQQYDWPGNVRELQNAVERAFILSRGGPLQFNLPDQPTSSAPTTKSERPASEGILTRREIRQLERDNLTAALTHTGGRIFGPGGAAELLGMKPTTLTSRIKALGIKPQANVP